MYHRAFLEGGQRASQVLSLPSALLETRSFYLFHIWGLCMPAYACHSIQVKMGGQLAEVGPLPSPAWIPGIKFRSSHLAALSTESSHQPQDSYCSLHCMPDLLAQELPGILLSPHHTVVLQMCATVPSFMWVLGIRRNSGLHTRVENAVPAKSSSQPPNTFDLE